VPAPAPAALASPSNAAVAAAAAAAAAVNDPDSEEEEEDDDDEQKDAAGDGGGGNPGDLLPGNLRLAWGALLDVGRSASGTVLHPIDEEDEEDVSRGANSQREATESDAASSDGGAVEVKKAATVAAASVAASKTDSKPSGGSKATRPASAAAPRAAPAATAPAVLGEPAVKKKVVKKKAAESKAASGVASAGAGRKQTPAKLAPARAGPTVKTKAAQVCTALVPHLRSRELSCAATFRSRRRSGWSNGARSCACKRERWRKGSTAMSRAPSRAGPAPSRQLPRDLRCLSPSPARRPNGKPRLLRTSSPQRRSLTSRPPLRASDRSAWTRASSECAGGAGQAIAVLVPTLWRRIVKKKKVKKAAAIPATAAPTVVADRPQSAAKPTRKSSAAGVERVAPAAAPTRGRAASASATTTPARSSALSPVRSAPPTRHAALSPPRSVTRAPSAPTTIKSSARLTRSASVSTPQQQPQQQAPQAQRLQRAISMSSPGFTGTDASPVVWRRGVGFVYPKDAAVYKAPTKATVAPRVDTGLKRVKKKKKKGKKSATNTATATARTVSSEPDVEATPDTDTTATATANASSAEDNPASIVRAKSTSAAGAQEDGIQSPGGADWSITRPPPAARAAEPAREEVKRALSLPVRVATREAAPPASPQQRVVEPEAAPVDWAAQELDEDDDDSDLEDEDGDETDDNDHFREAERPRLEQAPLAPPPKKFVPVVATPYQPPREHGAAAAARDAAPREASRDVPASPTRGPAVAASGPASRDGTARKSGVVWRHGRSTSDAAVSQSSCIRSTAVRVR
jgi:hypothetical protein